jgi:hypothetical protein
MARIPPPTVDPETRPDPELVRAHLTRILDSPAFRGSKRSSDFLRYVVEETLQGHTDGLKERTLGVTVFERAPDYDTNQDPVVRNTAGQVRRRLAQFYQESTNGDKVRIELPAGSYIPDIARVPTGVAILPEPPLPPPLPLPPPRTGRRWWLPLSAAALIAAAVALWWYAGESGPAHSAVTEFWDPILRQPGNVVICVGQGHAYKLAGDWDRRFDEALARGVGVTGPPVPVADVMPVFSQYVALSDMLAATRLTALFAGFGKQADVRGGRNTGLEDLRRKPVVLVGAMNNDWTLNLTGELRFYFESDGNRVFVRDRQNPSRRDWVARTDVPITQTPVDYAIVTRVFNPTTEQSIVVAAGIRGAGTEAAGEFLTRADHLQKAPRMGHVKNVQFVLAAKLFSGSPGPPAVIASHIW